MLAGRSCGSIRGGDGSIEIIDLQSRTRLARWQAHDGVVSDLAFCPSHARWLASTSGDDGTLNLWDIPSQRPLFSTNSSKGPWANLAFSPSGRAFSPDGKNLAVGSADGRAAFLEAMTLRPVQEPIRLHTNQITHIAYGLDGTVLATGGGFGSGVVVNEVASGRILRRFSAVESLFPIQAIAVSPEGRLLATGSPKQRVCVQDLASGRVLHSCRQRVRLLHAITFSPDGKLLAFSDELGAIFLWDLTGLRPLRKLSRHAGAVNALTFSPDGHTLASGGMNHAIKLWRPKIDQEVVTLPGHSAWVWSLRFAQHGDSLLSAGQDGTLKIWRAPSFQEIDAKEQWNVARPTPVISPPADPH